MKTFINTKRFKFYVLTGAVWLMIWILFRLINSPETFVLHALNEGWRLLYIVAVNFIFFEYSLPLIRKSRPSVLTTILLTILLVAVQLLLVSAGLYGWRWLGIVLHIYTSLREVTLFPDGPYAIMIEGILYEAQ